MCREDAFAAIQLYLLHQRLEEGAQWVAEAEVIAKNLLRNVPGRAAWDAWDLGLASTHSAHVISPT